MLHSTTAMTVGDASRCPRCGTLRPTDATSLDLCPACLLTTALSMDAGVTAEGLLYVASEYVAGWPLTALPSRASVGIGERARMAHQLIGAIGAAHAAGVVHLRLDTSSVKIATANGPRATILGLGSSLIVDGAEARPEADLPALVRLVHHLGIELPDREYGTVAAIGDALSSSSPS
jgi:hypothetical protein